jgi:Cu2+-exporting ATPase
MSLFTAFAATGTGMATALSAKTRRKAQATPLRLADSLVPVALNEQPQPVLSLPSLFSALRSQVDSFRIGLHTQQLRTLMAELGQETEISEAEREINRKSQLFLVSFGASAVAALIYPPLSVLSLPVALYILKDVYRASYDAVVKRRELTVDTLVSVLMTLFISQGYYLACNLYLVLYLLNRKLMLKLKQQSSNQIVDVFRQRPRFVWVLRDEVETEVAIEAVQQGNTVIVNAGEMIPVDGVITAGIATVDQQLLTGEAQPNEKAPGDRVFALTVVLAGRIELLVDKTGEETTAAQIGQILNQTVDAKTEMQLWAERITDQMVLPTFLAGALAWPLLGPNGALVILNSHFRYRLTLITSTSVLNFLNLAARQGILIKDGRTLERMRAIDTIVFDKTGTLTLQQPHVSWIHTSAGYDEMEILWMAAAAEYKQSHPIAKAILAAAKECALQMPTIEQAEYRVGYGITVTINGQVVRVGSNRFMAM